ncbi:MAG TPA: hypothetical protein VII63_07395 [Caulobacteraceae bacterium]
MAPGVITHRQPSEVGDVLARSLGAVDGEIRNPFRRIWRHEVREDHEGGCQGARPAIGAVLASA